MEKVIFFAIEGLDGVGKTTLVNNLKKEGFNVAKTPPKIYSPLRKEIHHLKEASLFYYLSSLAYTLEKEMKDKNRFILDRYIFSTITQYVSNTTLSIDDFNKLFYKFKDLLPMPTITFFIDLDFKTRLSRIEKRSIEEKSLDNTLIEYNNFWTKAMEEYNFGKKIILDGNKKEIDLVNEVIEYMEKEI